MANRDYDIKAYDQLCQSYRAIDDFRAKLLGFLPLVSATGIGFLLDQLQRAESLEKSAKDVFAGVGVFGVLITLGLFAYEIYGIKKCSGLIQAGRRIEALLEIENGQFRTRAQNVAYIINEPFAAGIVYPTVLAAWTFFVMAFAWPKANPEIPIVAFSVGLVGTLIYDWILRRAAGQAAGMNDRSARRKEAS